MNFKITCCCSVNLSHLEYLKIPSLTELIRNIHEKVVPPLFKLRTPKLQISSDSRYGLNASTNIKRANLRERTEGSIRCPTPPLQKKKKLEIIGALFQFVSAFRFCIPIFQTHLPKFKHDIFARDFHIKLSWRITVSVCEVQGIYCWSCPANEIKLGTKICNYD